MDALLLARIQFGFTVSFHIVFPGLTIGLASYLAVLEGLWLRTGRQVYMDLYHFWSKVFAVAFGMGVVSGLVMAYQFGTNWSEFSRFAGGITGPLLTYEVLTAFFLEAGFLGVMLFGMQRVGPGLHFVSTLAVAVGTLISSTWILASNSCGVGQLARSEHATAHDLAPSGRKRSASHALPAPRPRHCRTAKAAPISAVTTTTIPMIDRLGQRPAGHAWHQALQSCCLTGCVNAHCCQCKQRVQ